MADIVNLGKMKQLFGDPNGAIGEQMVNDPAQPATATSQGSPASVVKAVSPTTLQKQIRLQIEGVKATIGEKTTKWKTLKSEGYYNDADTLFKEIEDLTSQKMRLEKELKLIK